MAPETTWLTPDEYLASFRADTDRLTALARVADLAAPVPSCPGWALADLVRHCGSVYAHKVAALRAGRAPGEGEWDTGGGLQGDALVDWHDERARELADLLAEEGPAAECW